MIALGFAALAVLVVFLYLATPSPSGDAKQRHIDDWVTGKRKL